MNSTSASKPSKQLIETYLKIILIPTLVALNGYLIQSLQKAKPFEQLLEELIVEVLSCTILRHPIVIARANSRCICPFENGSTVVEGNLFVHGKELLDKANDIFRFISQVLLYHIHRMAAVVAKLATVTAVELFAKELEELHAAAVGYIQTVFHDDFGL